MVAHGGVLFVGPEKVHAHFAEMHHGAHLGDGHHHGHDEAGSSGQPATADAATKRNVGKLHEVVREALSSDEVRASEVRDAYQQIFIECEMQGEDHNELHRFLMPIGTEIDALESGDRSALARLDEQLSEFDQRFH